jgi:PelA/Pel-15E family pectate lyase
MRSTPATLAVALLVQITGVWGAWAQQTGHFAPERLALIAPEVRPVWDAYLERSAFHAERDLAAINLELMQVEEEAWSPAPASRSALLRDEMTPEWYAGEEALRIAEIILSFQTPTGGWAKNIDLRKRPREPGESFYSGGSWSYIGTFDNDATTREMRFLAKAYSARGEERFREAFLSGLNFIFEAQFPNGCWPQVYPLQGGYHDAATFNDEAIPNILRLLHRIADAEFAFVAEHLRREAGAAMWRGVECVLAAQVSVDGELTAWGQQHDPITLEPTQGRPYEHPSLTAGESVEVVEFLMQIENPTPAIVKAVHAAVAWFEAVALYDLEYEYPVLRARDGGGPIWARFYEIETNRPIFSNRDGVVLYDWHDLDDERRRGYAWYRTHPAEMLAWYREWSKHHPLPE